jgi:hypothetical protein
MGATKRLSACCADVASRAVLSDRRLSLDEVPARDLGDRLDGGAVLPAAALRLSRREVEPGARPMRCSRRWSGGFCGDHEPGDDREPGSSALLVSSPRASWTGARALALDQGGGDPRDDLVPHVVRARRKDFVPGAKHPHRPPVPDHERGADASADRHRLLGDRAPVLIPIDSRGPGVFEGHCSPQPGRPAAKVVRPPFPISFRPRGHRPGQVPRIP